MMAYDEIPPGRFDDDGGTLHPLPTDRVPPNDLAAEAAVVSACILQESTIPARRAGLRAEDFYSDANRKIFEALTELEASGSTIDILTIRGYLDDRGWLLRVGGPKYIAEMLDAVPAVTHVTDYVQRIRAKSALRAVITAARRIAAEGYSASDPATFIADARKSLEQVDVTGRGRLELLTPGWMTTPLPAKLWVSKQLWIGPGRPTMMSGYGYSGKSVAIQSMAVSVSSGLPIWGQYRVQNPGPVLHIDHEQGREDTIRRYQRIGRAMGVDPAEVEANLRVTCLPRHFRLSNPDAEDVLEDACDGVRLCMIDSLTNSTPGLDQIGIEIGHAVAKLMAVSDRTGCSFVLIHHDAKGGKERDPKERAKGNGAIFANCGTVFQLTGKVQDDGSTITEVINVKVGAGGDKPLSPFCLKIDDVLSDDGQERWGLECQQMALEQVDPPKAPNMVRADNASRIAQALRLDPGMSGRELAEALKIRRQTIGATLDYMLREGIVTKEKRDAGRGGGDAWRLTSEVGDDE